MGRSHFSMPFFFFQLRAMKLFQRCAYLLLGMAVDSGQRLNQYGGVADSGRHTSMAVLSVNATTDVAEDF